MTQLMPFPRQKFFYADGTPLAGGKLFSYFAGGSTPHATFADATGETENANPVVLDSNGEASVWLDGSGYKFVLKDPAGNILWTVDGVFSIAPGSITTDKIADEAVTRAKLNDGIIGANEIEDNAVTTPKIAAGAVTQAKLADNSVGTAELIDASVTRAKIDNAVFSALAIAKNKIINGAFNVRYRGLSVGAMTSPSYITDRWFYARHGTQENSGGPDTDVPTIAQSGSYFNGSLKVTCSTASATVAHDDYTTAHQYIEGFVFQGLAQRDMTLSFWVKATKTGTYCASFRNQGNDRSYVAEYTVNATNTWEKKTVTVPASPSAGTWSYASSVGLDVCFAISAGSDSQTTPGAWQTGNFIATANQVNGCDTIGNIFRITGIQLEAGDLATPFEDRMSAFEEILCKRYYETVPFIFRAYNTGVVAVNALGGSVNFSVGKCVIPSCTISFTSNVKSNNPGVLVASQQYADLASDFTASSGAASFGGVLIAAAEGELMGFELAPILRQRFFDGDGKPLAGGLIHTYLAGTTIPSETFVDSTGETPNENPIVLDSEGYCDIWVGSSSYKFIVCDPNDAPIFTKDNVTARVTGTVGVPAGGKSGQVLAKLSDADFDNAWVDPAAGFQFAALIANNQGVAADLVGMLLDSTKYKRATIQYLIERITTSTGATELVEGGEYCAVFKSVSNSWFITPVYATDDAGVPLSITAAGQAQYISTNITGTPSVSKISYKLSTLVGA